MTIKKYNTIDLFAGCGGLYEGFEKTRHFNSVGFVEWERSPCETLISRLKNKWGYQNAKRIVLHFDIQRIDELFYGWDNDPTYNSHKGLLDIVGDKNVDLIIGGPPCQAYSIAGRVRDANGMQYDYRNYLFESYIEVVKKFNPKAFVFENVEGMLSAKPGGTSIVERITKSFAKIGFIISDDIRKNALFNAAEFGVPQNRKRIIIIGANRNLINSCPENAVNDFYHNILHKYKVKETLTVADAFKDLSALYPYQKDNYINGKKLSHISNGSDYLNHIPRYHNKRDQKIFCLLAQDKLNGTNKYQSIEALKELYFQMTGKKSNFHKYHVLEYTKPSNTIPAHLFKDGLRHIHPDPDQARSITPREAARLQSFDDDFVFKGSVGDQYKMIGNAVPPVFAYKIASAMKIWLDKFF